jgi:branched-chain amino acid aminotransferase
MKNLYKLHGFGQAGVFESLRVYNGKVFKLQEHLQRFVQSAKALNLVLFPIMKIEERILKVFAKSGLSDAYIRVSFSEENGLAVIVKPLSVYSEEYYKNGVEISSVPTQRDIPSALDGQIKCENFLPGVMAKIESPGAFEAILLNKDGYVTEGTVSNIFIVQYNRQPGSPEIQQPFFLVTPPPYLGVLEGVTRKIVMEIAEEIGFSVEEKPFTRYNLYAAGECFLTNTTMEIMPVTKIDGRVIGNGKPGPLTARLKQGFEKVKF